MSWLDLFLLTLAAPSAGLLLSWEHHDHTSQYPLARNQYINNSPGIFSCIRAGANTGATCIRTEMNSLKNLADMRENDPSEIFSCIRAKANTGPARIRAKTTLIFLSLLFWKKQGKPPKKARIFSLC